MSSSPARSRSTFWIARAAVLPWWLLLAILPFFPSQDGPAHLATADAFLALLRGDAVATTFLVADTSLLTNWAGTLALAGLLATGLGPSLAESLLLAALGLLWVEVFARVGERLGRSPWSAWLVLPFLVSRLTFMGFWSFLASVGFGLLAFVVRPPPGGVEPSRRGARTGARVVWNLAAVAATLSHPLGGLVFLGLAGGEEMLRGPFVRRAGARSDTRPGVAALWRRLLPLVPHAVLWLAATATGLGGSSRSRWPMPDLPDLTAVTFATRPGLGLDEGARALLAVGVVVWWWVARRSRQISEANESANRRAFTGALVLVALGSFATSFGPEMIGGGSHLRSRGAFAAWACLALALPLARLETTRRWLEPLGAGLALVAVAPAFALAHQLATEQTARLAELPTPEPGTVLLGGYGSARMDGAYRWHFNAPDLHVIQRWAAEHRVFDFGNYQFHTGHFPLLAKRRFQHQTMETLQWRPEHLPWSELAEVADLAVLRRAENPARRAALPCRAGATWRPEVETDSWIVLRSRAPAPLTERATVATEDLRVAPRPEPLSLAATGGSVQVDAGSAYGCFPWRIADVQNEAGEADSALGPTEIVGLFDEQGRTQIRLEPSATPRSLVLIPE